ncbi:hypothetical protein HOF56_02635 [Candidatus Peribacteria bacterium]|jgi:hypothetical protein|nr:hypothetical protein [Candidatus Peribacteria bacterium]MBT4020935.1 hypothetical protein [Candidatus Peribacteria bacterium]MBT4240285.1 hypothetical protein [Candidatus Peribacteria bacterium]MBT4473900.1 hypothetical protein [Candidatus Peribacteria bacterium]
MRKIYFAIFILSLSIVITSVLSGSQKAFARILEGNDFLKTQVESDYDRDGDVDFLDFTVFSAFYEED